MNLGWLSSFSNEELSEHIPKDVYFKINHILKAGDGTYYNKPFFIPLKQKMENLKLYDVPMADKEQIKDSLKICKQDKDFDDEGERPFFAHWRRVKPTEKSLIKIERYFGQKIKENCRKNNITAVWSENEKENSLLFTKSEFEI